VLQTKEWKRRAAPEAPIRVALSSCFDPLGGSVDVARALCGERLLDHG